jgi:O-antigen ligase
MTKEIQTTRASKVLYFLLCATVIFTTVAYGAVHQPIIAIFYFIAVVIVLLWAFDAFSTGVLRFNRSLLQIPLMGTVIYGILQTIPFGSLAETAGVAGIPRTISFDPFATQISALHFLALSILLAAFLTYVDSLERLRKTVYVVTIFGFIFAFFAILQAVLSPNKIYGIYEPRFAVPFGSFVNRHNFAAYMEMTLALPLGLMFAGAINRDKRLIYITAIGLMGVALLLSGSRGGFIALVAEVFFLIILTTKTKSSAQTAVKIGLSVLLMAVIVFGAFLIGGESSLTRFAETAASKDFSTNRTHIWNVTLSVIKNTLPFGAGLGGFGTAYTPFDSMSGFERVEQAHNDYLQVLADAGIVGLLLGAFFIYELFKNGLRNAKTASKFRRGVAVSALAGCFAVLVHSLFDFVLHTTAISVLFVVLISLVVTSGAEFADDQEDHQMRQKKRRAASVTPIEEKRHKPAAENV